MGIQTAGQMVAQTLRRHILNGHIEDETELTQEWIASQLGVSRMPIREALYLLEYEGYIERKGNRRLNVIGIESGMLNSRAWFYVSVETEACLRIARSLDREGSVCRLYEAVDNLRAPGREIQFHSLLFQLTQDRYLQQLFAVLILPSLEILLENDEQNGDSRIGFLEHLVSSIDILEMNQISEYVQSYYTSLVHL